MPDGVRKALVYRLVIRGLSYVCLPSVCPRLRLRGGFRVDEGVDEGLRGG